jgi:hypothetical protein
VVNEPTRADLIADLQLLSRGELDADTFRARYLHEGGLPEIESIWHGLEHFMADADIRAKDRRYREMQEGEFAKLIQLLQEGAPPKKLARSFLGRSWR